MNCIDAEVLGAFVEGKLDARRRLEVMRHLETCEACTAAAGIAAESLREESETARGPSRGSWWLAAAAMLAVGLIAAALFRDRWAPPSPMRVLVAAAPSDGRDVEPRLTGGFRWAEYRGPARDERPGTPDSQRLRLHGAAGAVLDRAAKDSSPDTAHAAGVALLLIDDAPQSIDKLRSIASNDPATWSDLAAAYYASGRVSALPQALAAADRALALNGRLPEALFNRALVLERMGLLAEAGKAWERYLEIDPSSPWANEAREHLRRLSAPHSSFEKDLQRLTAAALVATYPQQSRTWGEGPFLAEWAENRGKLSLARAIGEALAKRSDETLLRDAVAAIDRAADQHPLTEAHLLYRDGRIAYSRRELTKARDLLVRAADAFERGGSPMALEARYFAANVVYDLDRPEEAFDQLTTVLGKTPASYRALRAQILWQRALCSSTLAHWSEAIADAEESRAIFKRLGEERNRAFLDVVIAEMLDYSEEVDGAWERRTGALAEFSRDSANEQLVASLGAAVRSEVRRGNDDAARALAGIEIDAARRGTNSGLLASALFYRALLEHRAGGGDPMRDLAEARAIAPRTGDARRVLAEIDYAEGVVARDRDPRRSVQLLSRSADFFRASFPVYLPAALLERGRAFRDTGDNNDAFSDFLAGIQAIERRRDPAVAREIETAAFFDDEQSLFGEAVELELSKGDARQALTYADRALQQALRSRFPSARFGPAPTNETLIEIYDTGRDVVAFLVNSGRIEVVRAGTAARVRDDARMLVDALAQRKSDHEVQSHAASLYATLIAPLRQSLSTARAVVIVADPRLGFIPFAALFDAGSGRYLIEDFEIASRPADALPLRDRTVLSAADPALIVADPDFAGGAKLPGAEREGIEVAASYRAPEVLTGDRATLPAVVRALGTHRVFHYAGHAATPEHSAGALLLSGGRLYASDVARLDLRALDVAVLAACQSSRAAQKSVPRDLATAFLVAGARNVVGTGWEIDDATSSVTFAELHRAIAAGAPVAAAVRDVQLEAIHARKHPSSWAAMTVFSTERSQPWDK